MAKLLSTNINGTLDVTGKSTFKDGVIISGSTIVGGDLVVRGDLTYVETKDLKVADRLIELNHPASGSTEVTDLGTDPAGIDILGAKADASGNKVAHIHYNPVDDVFEINRPVKAELASELPGSLTVEVKYSESESTSSVFTGQKDVNVLVDLSEQSASLAKTKEDLEKVSSSVKRLSDSVYGSKGEEEDPDALFPRVGKLEKGLQAEIELRDQQKENADKEFKACVHWDVSESGVVGNTISLKQDTGAIISSNKNGGVPLIKMTKWNGIQIGGSANEYIDLTINESSSIEGAKAKGKPRVTVNSTNQVAYLSDVEAAKSSSEEKFVKKKGDTMTGDLNVAGTVVSASGDVKVGKDLYFGEKIRISCSGEEISFEFLG